MLYISSGNRWHVQSQRRILGLGGKSQTGDTCLDAFPDPGSRELRAAHPRMCKAEGSFSFENVMLL